MSRVWTTILLAATISTFALADDSAGAERTSPVGLKVNDFTLSDFRGKEHSLSDYKEKRLLVVVFLGTECPLAKLYGPRLAKLADEYADEGVAFLGINSNRQDSITEIAASARRHGIEFPMLKDLGNKVADQMQAVRTPEVFVLDEDRVVRYWGRIDDQYGVGYIRDQVERRDLAVAIDQLLAGQPVETPENPSVGCYIGRVREPKSEGKVTYSNQIARIFQSRCMECHREGEIAPFALTKYDEVAGWAETIAEVVRDERMPPWHAHPDYGSFVNDRRMPQQEKELIDQWVADGAPQGDPSELPPPLKPLAPGWQFEREPDQVIYMSDDPYTVQAEGEVKYQYFSVDPGFTEDKWVRAAELIPGNRAVVHHILVFVRPPEAEGRRRGQGFLAAYVPGLRANRFPEGAAKRIPAGAQLIFQVHYTPIGSVVEDRSKLGLVFAQPEEVTHVVKTLEAINSGFEIPPHAENHAVDAESPSYDFDMELVAMSPHMHLRGKSFYYEARFPDGTKETLLEVPRYDFNWQTTYRLSDAKPLPAGTTIYCVAHYDNSENNLVNPDPGEKVTWGDQTWEEMMIGFFDVAVELTPEQIAEGTFPDFSPKPESRARQLIRPFDKNGDGQLTRAEVPLRAQLFFLRLDRNKDGTLTVEEIVETIEERRRSGNDRDDD